MGVFDYFQVDINGFRASICIVVVFHAVLDSVSLIEVATVQFQEFIINNSDLVSQKTEQLCFGSDMWDGSRTAQNSLRCNVKSQIAPNLILHRNEAEHFLN